MANARERDLYVAKAAFAKSTRPFANAAEMQWLQSIPNQVSNTHNRGSSNGSKQEKLCNIIPRLFLSSWETERNLALLASANVTHILQVGQELYPSHDSQTSRLTYLQLPVFDLEEQDIIAYFHSSFRFIQDGLASGGNTGVVLVHCAAGISRSATIILAYLMHTQQLSLREARAIVRASRPSANPNLGFLLQLQWYEQQGSPDPDPGPRSTHLGPRSANSSTSNLSTFGTLNWPGWDLDRFMEFKARSAARGGSASLGGTSVVSAVKALSAQLVLSDTPPVTPKKGTGSAPGAAPFSSTENPFNSETYVGLRSGLSLGSGISRALGATSPRNGWVGGRHSSSGGVEGSLSQLVMKSIQDLYGSESGSEIEEVIRRISSSGGCSNDSSGGATTSFDEVHANDVLSGGYQTDAVLRPLVHRRWSCAGQEKSHVVQQTLLTQQPGQQKQQGQHPYQRQLAHHESMLTRSPQKVEHHQLEEWPRHQHHFQSQLQTVYQHEFFRPPEQQQQQMQQQPHLYTVDHRKRGVSLPGSSSQVHDHLQMSSPDDVSINLGTLLADSLSSHVVGSLQIGPAAPSAARLARSPSTSYAAAPHVPPNVSMQANAGGWNIATPEASLPSTSLPVPPHYAEIHVPYSVASANQVSHPLCESAHRITPAAAKVIAAQQSSHAFRAPVPLIAETPVLVADMQTMHMGYTIRHHTAVTAPAFLAPAAAAEAAVTTAAATSGGRAHHMIREDAFIPTSPRAAEKSDGRPSFRQQSSTARCSESGLRSAPEWYFQNESNKTVNDDDTTTAADQLQTPNVYPANMDSKPPSSLASPSTPHPQPHPYARLLHTSRSISSGCHPDAGTAAYYRQSAGNLSTYTPHLSPPPSVLIDTSHNRINVLPGLALLLTPHSKQQNGSHTTLHNGPPHATPPSSATHNPPSYPIGLSAASRPITSPNPDPSPTWWAAVHTAPNPNLHPNPTPPPQPSWQAPFESSLLPQAPTSQRRNTADNQQNAARTPPSVVVVAYHSPGNPWRDLKVGSTATDSSTTHHHQQHQQTPGTGQSASRSAPCTDGGVRTCEFPAGVASPPSIAFSQEEPLSPSESNHSAPRTSPTLPRQTDPADPELTAQILTTLGQSSDNTSPASFSPSLYLAARRGHPLLRCTPAVAGGSSSVGISTATSVPSSPVTPMHVRVLRSFVSQD